MIIGKNTLIKKALKFMTKAPEPSSEDYEDHKKWTQIPALECLEPLMRLNVGLIFSEDSYMDLRTKVEAEVISMPARTGIVAPCDVVIPAGPTGIEVGKIDLFHKLNISCKTVKAAIEVVKEVKIITKDEKVGEGATQICKLLGIVPFEYKLEFVFVYMDGVILDKSIIDMPLEAVTENFTNFAGQLTALALGADIPNALSVPHFISNAFKQCLAIGEEVGYSFKQLADAKNNASKAVASGPVETNTTTKKAEVKAEEEEEEESEGADLGDFFG